MAKIADSSMDGELTIKVKATLTVDEDTFDTCVNIMAIYAREHGIKGMTLDFRKTAPSWLGCVCRYQRVIQFPESGL